MPPYPMHVPLPLTLRVLQQHTPMQDQECSLQQTNHCPAMSLRMLESF